MSTSTPWRQTRPIKSWSLQRCKMRDKTANPHGIEFIIEKAVAPDTKPATYKVFKQKPFAKGESTHSNRSYCWESVPAASQVREVRLTNSVFSDCNTSYQVVASSEEKTNKDVE